MPRTLAALVAVLTLAAAPAFAGIADSPLPALIAGETTFHLYSVPGVIDSGGLATYFSCTSTDTAQVQVCVEVFTSSGFQISNDCSSTSVSRSVAPGATVLFGTNAAAWVSVDSVVGGSTKGSARIVATSKKLACTAFVADLANTPPTSAWQLTIIAKTKQKAAN